MKKYALASKVKNEACRETRLYGLKDVLNENFETINNISLQLSGKAIFNSECTGFEGDACLLKEYMQYMKLYIACTDKAYKSGRPFRGHRAEVEFRRNYIPAMESYAVLEDAIKTGKLSKNIFSKASKIKSLGNREFRVRTIVRQAQNAPYTESYVTVHVRHKSGRFSTVKIPTVVLNHQCYVLEDDFTRLLDGMTILGNIDFTRARQSKRGMSDVSANPVSPISQKYGYKVTMDAKDRHTALKRASSDLSKNYVMEYITFHYNVSKNEKSGSHNYHTAYAEDLAFLKSLDLDLEDSKRTMRDIDLMDRAAIAVS